MVSIKKFLRKDWRKLAIFGTFLIIGFYLFTLNPWQINEKALYFFYFPMYLVGNILSIPIGLFLTLIYWYVFSCSVISLFDYIKTKIKKQGEK